MSNKTFFVAAFVLLTTIGGVLSLSSRGEPVVVETNLENLPMQIDGYQGTEDFFPDYVYQELNADKHVYRHYLDEEGNRVSLYIGYYGTSKGGRSSHNPYACLPGAGWSITETDRVAIRSKNYPEGVPVNYIRASKEGMNNVVLHWYQTGGKTVLSTGIQQNIHRFLGRVLHNRNDGAYVQVAAFSNDHTLTEAKGQVREFAGKVLGFLPDYWPVEK